MLQVKIIFFMVSIIILYMLIAMYFQSNIVFNSLIIAKNASNKT